MSAEPATQIFRFCQFELPWALGPPDGRYLMRPPGASPGVPACHVLAFTTLSAPVALGRLERRRGGRRRDAPAAGAVELTPAPVPSMRATVIDVGERLRDPADARRWLAGAGEQELAAGLAVLNRALLAFRVVSADPHVHELSRGQALVARIGYGAGEEVADGRWSEAVELGPTARAHTRRARVLEPQAQLAAVLGGRRALLVCEELALRARLDLSHGCEREAALSLAAALDAAFVELADATSLAERLAELRGSHGDVASAARRALAGRLSDDQGAVVALTLSRLEATLRARAVGLGSSLT